VPDDPRVAELVDGLLEAVTAQLDRPLPTALREAFITAAHTRWERLGRPAVEQHGLTVTTGGTTTLWVGSPSAVVSTI
jgi:hypothetical protein